ncbi:MAG: FAD-binding oxidoreductase [Devosia sp.]
MNIETLKRAVKGHVISNADRDFGPIKDALIWNGRKSGKNPQIVVRAESPADVQAAVRFAADNGLRVSARGSGHHFALLSMQEGMLIDLSRLNSLQVDTASRTARVGPSLTNGELAAALAKSDLAFPVGHCASVSLSGYLLGGGVGWNSGAWGIACHNVLDVDVVLADGSLVTASDTQNPDVFWAARGAGPEFFGIVTRYRLRLHPLPRAIRTSVWTYPLQRIAEVERWMTATMARVPGTVEFSAVMTAAPPPVAVHSARTVSAVATVFADSEPEAANLLAGVGAGAPPAALDVQPAMPTPFDILYQIMGQFFPEGLRFAADSNWAIDGASLFAGLAQSIAEAPSARSFGLGVVLPSAQPPQLPDAAFSMVAPVFSCAYAVWPDANGDADNMGWLRRSSARLAPISAGHYVGEADLERPERTRACFAPAAWSRLLALQQRYDPAGLFHRPTLGAASDTRRATEAVL